MVLFFSCSQSEGKIVSSQPDETFTTIYVESDWEIKPGTKLSEFIEEIEFIPLEVADECLLHGIGQAQIMNNYIYVVDDPIPGATCIYQFDRNGHFVRQIGSQGEGPREFVQMRGFVLNHTTQEIYILDGVRKRMLRFLPDGSFNGVISIHGDCSNFTFNNDLFYLNDPYSEGEDAKTIRIVNMKGKEKAQFIPNQRADLPFVLSGNIVTTPDKDVIFYEPLNDTVYSFSENNMGIKYVFNFGEYTMSPNQKEEYLEALAKKRTNRFHQSNYIRGASDIWETKQWMFFNVVKKSITYRGLYNKKNRTVSVQSSFIDDLYTVTGIGDKFVGNTETSLIACIDANRIRTVLEKFFPKNVRMGKMSLSELDSLTTFFSQYIPIDKQIQEKNLKNKKEEEKPKDLLEILQSMYGEGEELNPMLMIIDFKE